MEIERVLQESYVGVAPCLNEREALDGSGRRCWVGVASRS